jgi:hypothetical protein
MMGVFHSRNALEVAVQDLLVAGIDRADIDVSASHDELQRRLILQADSRRGSRQPGRPST